MALAALPPIISPDVAWYSSNSASIAPGALIVLLVTSVLDAMFYGEAAAGVLSPWMQGGNQKKTKQSGQTHVVHSDFHGAGKNLTHDFPRQLDGLVNVGLVLTLPALGNTGTDQAATKYAPSEKDINGNAYVGTATADTPATILGGYERGSDYASKVVMTAPATSGNNWTAYCSFAQYAIIDKVEVNLNTTHLLKFSGQDLLIIQDVYGVGKYGIDVVANSLFNTNDYVERAVSIATYRMNWSAGEPDAAD